MPTNEQPEIVPLVLKSLEDHQPADAVRQLIAADPSDARRIFAEAPPESIDELFTAASGVDAGRLLLWLVPQQAADLVARLPAKHAAAIIASLPSDERTDLLAALDPATQDAIELEMTAPQREEAARLMEFAPDSAGGLMETEYLAFPASALVQDAIRDIRTNQGRYAAFNIQYVYVIDRGGVLAGLVPVRDLLLAREEQPLAAIARGGTGIVMARADTSADDLADLFAQYGFLGLPVVDAQNRLLGVVNRADLLDRIEERTAEQFRRSQGIVGGEELRTMGVMRRTTRRLQWLGVNMVLCFGGAAVVALNQKTLADAIVLAAFLPVISAMSGNAAMQSATVTMRELTLGVIVPGSWRAVLVKESSLALTVGVLLGAGLGAVASLWGASWRIGVVVGGAMTVNTIMAVWLGSVVPLLLKRYRADPALASGPISTTLTDISGFSLTLLLARALI